MCEGADDIAFFRRLIVANRLPHFHLRSTANKRGERGGNTKFETALESIRGNRGFPMLRDILLVSDNDNNHDESFMAICKQITDAGFPSPKSQLKKSDGNPAITIMMVPLNGEPGNLECLCREAAERADKKAAQDATTFEALSGAENWLVPRRGKLWLRVNLASRAADPFVSLGTVFRDEDCFHLIPLNDRSFRPIAMVLSSFSPSHDPSRPPVKTARSRENALKLRRVLRCANLVGGLDEPFPLGLFVRRPDHRTDANGRLRGGHRPRAILHRNEPSPDDRWLRLSAGLQTTMAISLTGYPGQGGQGGRTNPTCSQIPLADRR